MISNELSAKILRFHHVEKWRVGTIARHLNVHHSVVRRVLTQAGIPKADFMKKESIITPYLGFILETFEKFPNLAASRLYQMVCERGFQGGEDHFRHLMALYRPRKPAEAYLRLRTLPGEEAQIDWGCFGSIKIGKAKRNLSAFVMVLSYSRKIFLRFYLNQQMSNFLRGHESAFHAWNGIPRVLLYDNLRVAVLERVRDAIRFHPTLLDFAAHYHFEPRPVAVARGNEKGRVERAIRYVRDNFFAARKWENLEDLNRQAYEWCEGISSERPCPEDKTKTVREVFFEEQTKLLTLPNDLYPTDEREAVNVGKTPYVRFDLNDYSVPYTYVRRVLTVSATPNKVSILDGGKLIAAHERCYDKGRQIEDEAHIKGLVANKREARKHRGQDRLINAVPSSQDLLNKAAERGYSLGIITANLLELLDDYGREEFEIAIKAALEQDVPHTNAVRIVLEKRREMQNKLPPIHLDLPKDKRVRELIVKPHDLKSYDQLRVITGDEDNDN
jgi:transposase